MIPHNITVYQPHELTFRCKASAVCDAWMGLARYNDKASTSKCVWVNEQHELLISVNRQALTHIKLSAKMIQARTGGKSLHILIGNLVLLRDHQEHQRNIQDNYKPKLYFVIAHHKDPNAYVIQSMGIKGPKGTVNR